MVCKYFSWFSKSEISIGINNFLFKTQYLKQQTYHIANSLKENYEKTTRQY